MTTENPILRLTVKAAAAMKEGEFVRHTGAKPDAGKHAAGPVHHDADKDENVAVTVMGVALVKAGAAIAADAGLKVAASGKVLTHTANTTLVGRALEAATADGDLIRAVLIPN